MHFSQDAMEAGSAAKVVDCILTLKSYHEWKQMGGGNGFLKNVKSPFSVHSASRMHARASGAISSDSCRRLDMSATCEKQPPTDSDNQKQPPIEGWIGHSSLCICLCFIYAYSLLGSYTYVLIFAR